MYTYHLVYFLQIDQGADPENIFKGGGGAGEKRAYIACTSFYLFYTSGFCFLGFFCCCYFFGFVSLLILISEILLGYNPFTPPFRSLVKRDNCNTRREISIESHMISHV